MASLTWVWSVVFTGEGAWGGDTDLLTVMHAGLSLYHTNRYTDYSLKGRLWFRAQDSSIVWDVLYQLGLSSIPKEDHTSWGLFCQGRPGPHLKRHDKEEGVSNTNSNGVILLTKFVEYDLVIFNQKNKFKTSWMHPHNGISLAVIVWGKDCCVVNIPRAMTSPSNFWKGQIPWSAPLCPVD